VRGGEEGEEEEEEGEEGEEEEEEVRCLKRVHVCMCVWRIDDVCAAAAAACVCDMCSLHCVLCERKVK